MESRRKGTSYNNIDKTQQSKLPRLNDVLDEHAIVKQVKKTLAQFTEKYKNDNIGLQQKDILIIIMLFIWIFIVIIFAVSISTTYTPLRFAF